jgi:peptidoglycan/xylan/chitin deacetylase (PgdA/CDA1 family)/SAM-dependent methyltransferase
LTNELRAKPDLDAAYCGYARVTPEGGLMDQQYPTLSGDLFAQFGRFCVFAIHACLIRRSLVEAAGGFDPSLRTCEDWDLWQRIARTGARFGPVGEILAYYRMRPDSASVDGKQLFSDGLRVLSQAHSPIPTHQLTNSQNSQTHTAGLPPENLPRLKLQFACWCAGLMLGQGQDAGSLLELIKDEREPALEPELVAQGLFETVPLATSRPLSAWLELWPALEEPLHRFLAALEQQAQATELVRRSRIILERLILKQSVGSWPLTIGTTQAVRIELTQPISDLRLPRSIERLQAALEFEGSPIGVLELPVCDGFIPGHVLADAIAAEFSWLILGCFFERTLYPQLRLEPKPDGLSIWRDDLCLALNNEFNEFSEFSEFNEFRSSTHPTHQLSWLQLHDQIGWTVFLQELWGRPEWPSDAFYNPQAEALTPRPPLPNAETANQPRNVEQTVSLSVDDGWLVVEVSEEIPSIELLGRSVEVLLTVGGVALGTVIVPVQENRLSAQALRVALTLAGGLELCHLAVREGLLGRPIQVGQTANLSLRARLAAVAAQRQQDEASPSLLLKLGEASLGTMPIFASGSTAALEQVLLPGKSSLVLGRRVAQEIETSASRRAALPAAAAQALFEAASVAGEPLIHYPELFQQPERIVYLPELIVRPWQRLAPPKHSETGSKSPATAVDNKREFFETLFTTQPDPWNYTSPYEQTKYEQTLALLPVPIGRALELACAEGHFTVQLAPRVGSLVAADISVTALRRAAERCAGLDNTEFINLDLIRDPLPGPFDLIVCSEILYYMGNLETLSAVAYKLAGALRPGGYLVTAHANLVVDEPDRPGFDWAEAFGAKTIGETLAATRPLRLVKELRVPLYRIQLFQRDPNPDLSQTNGQAGPEIVEMAEQPTPLPPDVAAHVHWQGGSPQPAPPPVLTSRLPILMYHRVAPTGSPATARYRLNPERFEAQLRHLRDAGFYSVSLAQWQTAMARKQPLPGRAIHLTFDDGYADFLEYAWPLLKQYNFSATVFLVAAEIGRSNRWDRVYGEELPLMGWPEIHYLQDEGVEFGSHSVSHSYLTALSPEQIVCEGARSRAILERGLGGPVKAFAYPYGDVDPAVQHLIGACGYSLALSCRPGSSKFTDPFLALPRIEVTGSDDLSSFIAKLNS